MKRKTKITLASISAALVVLSAAPRLVQAEDDQSIPLSAAIRTVILHGDGTALKLTTHADDVREARITTEDNIGCAITSTVETVGDQLKISVEKGRMRVGFWCDPDVTLSLPAGLSLEIGLTNLAADIRGTYDQVQIRTGQSVIDFDGAAEHFTLHGRRAAVRLNFPRDMPREAVELDVDTILSHVTFNGA
ncbi:hypothetical protein [Epibacterium sp. Ofav1-8]|uniref:hypothetical protein n=1 Tax=Epibacterium sp. Ofav1-8 TaxID=2917735 RepID=UPI001EF4739E|nr:hypothetical protein [Epibacterium sp. Ofav1-8]MCG7622227.1 hypothetical protein [Epibacterium sp. Ofav1-8]